MLSSEQTSTKMPTLCPKESILLAKILIGSFLLQWQMTTQWAVYSTHAQKRCTVHYSNAYSIYMYCLPFSVHTKHTQKKNPAKRSWQWKYHESSDTCNSLTFHQICYTCLVWTPQDGHRKTNAMHVKNLSHVHESPCTDLGQWVCLQEMFMGSVFPLSPLPFLPPLPVHWRIWTHSALVWIHAVSASFQS